MQVQAGSMYPPHMFYLPPNPLAYQQQQQQPPQQQHLQQLQPGGSVNGNAMGVLPLHEQPSTWSIKPYEQAGQAADASSVAAAAAAAAAAAQQAAALAQARAMPGAGGSLTLPSASGSMVMEAVQSMQGQASQQQPLARISVAGDPAARRAKALERYRKKRQVCAALLMRRGWFGRLLGGVYGF